MNRSPEPCYLLRVPNSLSNHRSCYYSGESCKTCNSRNMMCPLKPVQNFVAHNLRTRCGKSTGTGCVDLWKHSEKNKGNQKHASRTFEIRCEYLPDLSWILQNMLRVPPNVLRAHPNHATCTLQARHDLALSPEIGTCCGLRILYSPPPSECLAKEKIPMDTPKTRCAACFGVPTQD